MRRFKHSKRIVLTISLLLLIQLLVTGCSETTSEADAISNDFEYIGRCECGIYEYRDTKTGVHYLKQNGFCPRYNADGTLYVD